MDHATSLDAPRATTLDAHRWLQSDGDAVVAAALVPLDTRKDWGADGERRAARHTRQQRLLLPPRVLVAVNAPAARVAWAEVGAVGLLPSRAEDPLHPTG